MAIKAIGFDLDGTLIFSSTNRQSILDQTTKEVGVSRISRGEYINAHRERGVHDTRSPIFESLICEDEADPERLATVYRNLINKSIVPLESINKTIQELKEDYEIGLLTNGPSVAQQEKLEVLGWTDLFDAIQIGGDLGIGKPDIRAFQSLLKALEREPSETIFVGDEIETDIIGASNAGMHVLQVVYDGSPKPHPRADVIVERENLASDLPSIIQNFNEY